MGDWIIPVVFVGVFVGVVALAVTYDKKRRAGIERELAARGVRVVTRPDEAQRAEAFARAGPYGSLRTGAKGVDLCASGEFEGMPFTYIEHSYSTGSGKNRQTHVHSVFTTPCPASWPATRVRESHLGDTISGWMGKKDLQVEDAAFNKRWHISGDDTDFALLLLSPEVQTLMNGWKKGRIIAVERGVLALCVRTTLNGPEIVTALTDLRALRTVAVQTLGEA